MVKWNFTTFHFDLEKTNNKEKIAIRIPTEPADKLSAKFRLMKVEHFAQTMDRLCDGCEKSITLLIFRNELYDEYLIIRRREVTPRLV